MDSEKVMHYPRTRKRKIRQDIERKLRYILWREEVVSEEWIVFSQVQVKH